MENHMGTGFVAMAFSVSSFGTIGVPGFFRRWENSGARGIACTEVDEISEKIPMFIFWI